MKKLFFIILISLISINFACANEFELVKDSVYKYKNGIIYTIKNKNNLPATIYANSADYAQIINYGQYSQEEPYYLKLKFNFFNLDKIIKRTFSANSEIQNMQKELLANIDNFEKCPGDKCYSAIETFSNNYYNQLSATTLDDFLQQTPEISDIAEFINYVETKIKLNWKPPREDKSCRAIAIFQVNPQDGNIKKIAIKNESSLTEAAKNAVIYAINSSAPFAVPDILISRYKYATIPFEMTFDYNVLKMQKK